MTEIWSLNELCRCCHTDGVFKSLEFIYVYDNREEVYHDMLHETFGIDIKHKLQNSSYMICEKCINDLRCAYNFRKKVLECEKKFEEYCKNEESQLATEHIKKEEYGDHDDEDDDCKDNEDNEFFKNEMRKSAQSVDIDIKTEVKYDSKDEYKMLLVEPVIKDVNEQDDKNKINKDQDDKNEIKKENQNKNQSREQINKNERRSESTKRKLNKIKDKEQMKRLNTTKRTDRTIPKKKQEERTNGDSPKIDLSLMTVRNGHPCVYSCKSCSKSSTNKYSLWYHIKKEHLNLKKEYKCKECDSKFNSFSGLRYHVNKHTKEVYYVCDYCQRKFYFKNIIKKHIVRMHLGIKLRVVCYICGKTFCDKTQMSNHVDTVHKLLRPYACKVCSATFTANKHLKNHILTKHTEKLPHKCDICAASFLKMSQLENHQRKHALGVELDRHTCAYCDEAYDKIGMLRAHVRFKHPKEKKCQCTECGSVFSSVYNMKKHFEKVHENIVEYFYCHFCPNRYQGKPQLDRHVIHQHGPTPPPLKKRTKCKLCNRNVWNIEKHLMNHDSRPHKCSVCDKTYKGTNDLNRHIRTKHLLLRPHQCDYCDKKYVAQVNLKKHIQKLHMRVNKTEEDIESNLVRFKISEQLNRVKY